jgi:hypothetical protein
LHKQLLIASIIVFIVLFASISQDLPPELSLSLLIILFFFESLKLKSFYHRHLIVVVLLLLRKVLEFAAEHTPHHVPLHVVNVAVLELLHHLFHFPVRYKAH